MPELPEVEATARQLQSALLGATLVANRHSGKALRHPFPQHDIDRLQGESLLAVRRRAKFLMLEFKSGWLVVHLGMSGSLRCCDPKHALKLHDHVRLDFLQVKTKSATALVFHDPRRFGSWQWIGAEAAAGWEAASAGLSRAGLGFEPFDKALTATYLYRASRKVGSSIKQWLMNGRVVVGVGNIYASEALFDAGIHPARKAGSISIERYERLLASIRDILGRAIESGGSTLRDFQMPDGSAGSYRDSHQVYGRQGEPCPQCKLPIKKITQQQRSTFYCHACQR
jgi:formamidopyrimidine-DNA glycosylase